MRHFNLKNHINHLNDKKILGISGSFIRINGVLWKDCKPPDILDRTIVGAVLAINGDSAGIEIVTNDGTVFLVPIDADVYVE